MALHAGLTYAELQQRRRRRGRCRKLGPDSLALVALRTILLEETPVYGGPAPPVRIFSAADDNVCVCTALCFCAKRARSQRANV